MSEPAASRPDRPGLTVPTTSRMGVGLVLVAGVSALVGALYLAGLGHTGRALLLGGVTVVTTALAVAWWRTRGSSVARVPAALLVPASFAVWLLADNTTGVPLAGVAICAVVLEYGLRAGLAAGAGLIVVLSVIYLHAGVPLGGVVGNLVLSGVLIALGLFAAGLVAQLEQARRLAEAAARSRRDEALADLDRALAAERMDQARILHDDLGQRLTLIGMGMDLALRLRSRDPDAAWAEVERTRTEAANALAELRTLVRALSPLTPDEAAEVDLDAALDRLAGAFTGTGLQVNLVRTAVPYEPPALDPLAYRIIQEGLTNVVRHSDARHVTITLDAGDQQVVRVVDDGSHPADADPGFGLRHLRARVEAAGGTFHAAPGDAGFVVDARYPVAMPA